MAQPVSPGRARLCEPYYAPLCRETNRAISARPRMCTSLDRSVFPPRPRAPQCSTRPRGCAPRPMAQTVRHRRSLDCRRMSSRTHRRPRKDASPTSPPPVSYPEPPRPTTKQPVNVDPPPPISTHSYPERYSPSPGSHARNDHVRRKDETNGRHRHRPEMAACAKAPSPREDTQPSAPACPCIPGRASRESHATGTCPWRTSDNTWTVPRDFHRRELAAPSDRASRSRQVAPTARLSDVPQKTAQPRAAPAPHPTDEYWGKSRTRDCAPDGNRADRVGGATSCGTRRSYSRRPDDKPRSTTAPGTPLPAR